MTDSKALSTRSPKPWETQLKPSRIYRVLAAGLVVLSIRAIFLSPLAIFPQVILTVATLAVCRYSWCRFNRSLSLAWTADNQWHVTRNDQTISGPLASGCFRSYGLVIVAIKHERQTEHVMIWRDAVDARHFSQIQLQLAFTSRHTLA